MAEVAGRKLPDDWQWLLGASLVGLGLVAFGAWQLRKLRDAEGCTDCAERKRLAAANGGVVHLPTPMLSPEISE